MESITPTLRLRISSRCESEDEFVTLFHPLSVGRVVFLPTSHPEVVGSRVSATVVLANGRVALSGAAEVVDPHAAGLATAGKRGMALRFDTMGQQSEQILSSLRRPPPGTIPFGVPTGGTDDIDRLVCEVQRLPDPPGLPGVGPVSPPESEETPALSDSLPASKSVPPIADILPPPRPSLSRPSAEAPVLEESVPSVIEPAPLPNGSVPPLSVVSPRPPVVPEVEPMIPRGPKSVPPDISPPRSTPDIGPPRSLPTDDTQPISWTDDGGADDLTDVVPPPVEDPLPSIIAADPGALSSTEPLLAPLPPLQSMQPVPPGVVVAEARGTSTEVVRSAGSTRVRTVAVAAVAACLGLAGGWLLWKRDRLEAAAAPSTLVVSDDGESESPELEPQPEPTPAIEGDCRAAVHSNPEGAAVFYDQTLLGPAPYEGPIPCGPAQLTLTMPSYNSEQRRISPKAQDPTELEIELGRIRRAVRIVGRPKKALVRVDGEKVGRLPVTARIPEGDTAVIEVAKAGYKPHRVKVVADKGRTVKVRLRKR